MKYWLGVTDNGWFEFLSQANVDEVNFWQPSGRAPFVGLEQGAPFLFKLKRPFNHVAGGGFFVKFSVLPLSIVWETFGYKNGASSREGFETMIRRLAPNPQARDPEIGCTVLAAPFFWPRETWIADPVAFAGNIVRGRYYDTTESNGTQLWNQVQARLDKQVLPDFGRVANQPVARYGDSILVKPRLGQGAFRVLVTDAYSRRCAITGESTLPVLEAAHILPFAECGPNEVSNGMLLRSDFHKLFDLGFVTVTEDFRVEVSQRIREEWFNGKAYYRLHGKELANLPETASQRPDAAFLRWHNEHCYQG
ncbi:Restriction endonuclease [Georgfuchsia toluolica]|uniref:Restriction endonuclease n=1 Tax=Georgfuchsia toluolica TaxID=424218 RepID=A0A916J5F4_9PROT|nr:HNH endonuclease [Georgfuchsia toluolica]CAG4884549.1 Restriction endonuclease [Georgfuchsia toluolica]